LALESGELFLPFYRDKNDPLGTNASCKNPVFREQLHKHLTISAEDICSGQVSRIDFSHDEI